MPLEHIPETLLPVAERRQIGQSLRKLVPRSLHADWTPPADRRDPVQVLIEADRPFVMYADGDPIGDLPVRVKAAGHAVTMLVPADQRAGGALSPLSPALAPAEGLEAKSAMNPTGPGTAGAGG